MLELIVTVAIELSAPARTVHTLADIPIACSPSTPAALLKTIHYCATAVYGSFNETLINGLLYSLFKYTYNYTEYPTKRFTRLTLYFYYCCMYLLISLQITLKLYRQNIL